MSASGRVLDYVQLLRAVTADGNASLESAAAVLRAAGLPRPSADLVFEYCPFNLSIDQVLLELEALPDAAKSGEIGQMSARLLGEFLYLFSDFVPTCCESSRTRYVQDSLGQFLLMCHQCQAQFLLDGTVTKAVEVRAASRREFTRRYGIDTAHLWPDHAQLSSLPRRDESISPSALRDRFVTAAALIGRDIAALQVAGVHALAGLADEWITLGGSRGEAEAQACISLLCGFLRSGKAWSELWQAVVSSLRAHLVPHAEISWDGFVFDLSGAVLTGDLSLEGCLIVSSVVKLDKMKQLSGRFSLDGTLMVGGQITFRGAQFCGGRTTLERASLSGAAICFDWAKITGGSVSLSRASLTAGEVSLNAIKLTEGALNFEWTEFAGGAVSFHGARFAGGTGSFRYATFSGGIVTFAGARFTCGAVSFERARFGVSVSFDQAIFGGGVASFQKAEFTEMPVGPWGERQPECWPERARG